MQDQKKFIGSRIKALRTERGLSQEDVAAKTDRSVHAISQIERGVNAPSIETCMALADLFACSLDVLIGRDFQQAASKPARSGLEAEILGQIAAMSPNDLEALHLAMKALKHGR